MSAPLKIYFVTSNEGKVREANAVLRRYGLAVVPYPARKLELQSESLEEVASYAARSLAGKVPEPFFVEDSGLFIYSLRGFPGPYSSYVYRTIGLRGVLKLMEGVSDRRAKFVAVAALCLRGEIHVFRGEVEGIIALQARGAGGFGYDPIFMPLGSNKTFAEMSTEEKCRHSHRAKALRALAKYIIDEVVREHSGNSCA